MLGSINVATRIPNNRLRPKNSKPGKSECHQRTGEQRPEGRQTGDHEAVNRVEVDARLAPHVDVIAPYDRYWYPLGREDELTSIFL